MPLRGLRYFLNQVKSDRESNVIRNIQAYSTWIFRRFTEINKFVSHIQRKGSIDIIYNNTPESIKTSHNVVTRWTSSRCLNS